MKTVIRHRHKVLPVIILALIFFVVAKGFSQGTAPKVPGSLSVSDKSYNQISIKWIDSDLKTSVSFIVERSQNGGSYSVVTTITSQPSQPNPQFTDYPLSASTPYCYRVKAKNSYGESAYSNIACATTDALPVPSSLTATETGPNSIRLNWTSYGGKDSGVQVAIERATSSGGPFTQIGTASGELGNYTDNSGLSSATQYCYRIRGIWAAGYSGYSNTACATTRQTVPGAPYTLGVNVMSQTMLQPYWQDGSNNETGFEIERSTDGTNFAKITTTGANIGQFLDAGLNPGTLYYYRVRAINAIGASGYTNVASATTKPNPPSSPSNLAATAVSSNQIDLNWTDNSNNETGFELERSTDGTNFVKVGDIAAGQTSTSSTNLNANTQYWFRILAKNSGGNSGYSNTANATTRDIAPNTPQNLSAAPVSNTQINLSWNDNSGNETGFEVERSTDGANFSKIADLGANTTTYQNTGLSTLTKYWYRVRAKNAIGNSGYSNVVDATTFDVPPAAPSNLTATTASSSQINLAWTDNSRNEAGFEIERSTDGTNFGKVGDAGANATTFQSGGLTPNTKYWYRVRSQNSQGGSPYTNVAEATTNDVAPSAPQNLSGTPVSNTQINLSWTDISGTYGLETGYELERSADGGTFAKIADLAANVTTYQNTGLSTLTRYWYRLRAKNVLGYSPYSNVADVTTFDVPPIAPSNLTATMISSSQIDLTWRDNSSNETTFEIERSTDGITFGKISDLSANVITYQSTGLSPATRYWYRVRAKNSTNPSAYTNVADATTKDVIPKDPSNLVATVIDYFSIKLDWNDNSGNEANFLIERSTDGTSFAQIDIVGSNVKTYASKSLKDQTKYYFRVRAVNAIGNSGYSNVAEATTPKAPLPAKPENLKASPVDYDLVQLTWDAVSPNSTEVIIERSTKQDAGFVEIGRVTAAVPRFGDREILEVQDYYYRIKAVNAAGSSPYSDLATVRGESIITGMEPAKQNPLIYVYNKTLRIERTEPGNAVVKIFNINGVKTNEFEIPKESYTDLQQLTPGIYIVVLEEKNKIIRQKIAVY